MARIRLDRAELRRIKSGEAARKLRVDGPAVVNRAKILCPVDTGRLRASIQGQLKRNILLRPRFEVGSNVEYAPYVNDGTRPHIIRPRTARALRFVVGGQVVFARVVHHPGTRAQPFLDRALREIAAPRGYNVTRA